MKSEADARRLLLLLAPSLNMRPKVRAETGSSTHLCRSTCDGARTLAWTPALVEGGWAEGLVPVQQVHAQPPGDTPVFLDGGSSGWVMMDVRKGRCKGGTAMRGICEILWVNGEGGLWGGRIW